MARKLIFLIPEDRFFLSHFLARAVAARQAGYQVVVVTNVGRHREAIERHGMRVIPFNLDRGGTNPLRELATVLRIRSIYRRERPDVVHQVALKAVVYGSLAARTLSPTRVVNAPVGMGYVFTSGQAKARLLRPIVRALLSITLHVRGGVVVFENPDDLQSHVKVGAVDATQAVLIRGAGVDTLRFQPANQEPAGLVVVLVARMLYDKGVGEFVQAARTLRRQGSSARFVLVGAGDTANPACIPPEVLQGWVAEGVVDWVGHIDDMVPVWQGAHIACLPSYREGLPKANLEAMACGLPVVTTDVPGCRETVTDGDNGLLVPPRDAMALAAALTRLLDDAQLRKRMGQRGRDRVMAEFSDDKVVSATLKLYANEPPSASTIPA